MRFRMRSMRVWQRGHKTYSLMQIINIEIIANCIMYKYKYMYGTLHS